MPRIASAVAVLAALLPSALAQANDSYVDYNVEANPDLFPQCLATIELSFPDCENGPLSQTLVCDQSARAEDRAATLVSMFTLEELVNNTGNTGGGVPRLGLPNYQVWSESLHGLDRANWASSGKYSWATSFPQPILTMAALNRTLVHHIAEILSTQARAFNNVGRFGLDTYAPNINSFRHPVWGRGQETPGEDAYCLASTYAYEYITGIQGGIDPEHLKLVATAKHFAGYDIENWNGHSRLGNDMQITQQDLSEYYMPQFLKASRDARVHSVMCSYNAVNGLPSCANPFFLQTLLRDTFDFVSDGYVSGDCGAVYNVFNPHEYSANESSASAASLHAGTDIDCGTSYQYYFGTAFKTNELARQDIERGVIRLYTNLVRLGYFDGNDTTYRDLTWDDVLSTEAENIAYEAAVAGTVLLKNDGTLPLSPSIRRIALIGPWANATTQMQGNYFGPAPHLTSPLMALQASNLSVTYAMGTNLTTPVPDGTTPALTAAQNADAIIFAGGIDNTIESETLDRANLTWPSNQLSLLKELSQLGKPLIVLQMGGGQVDSSDLKNNANVSALLWGGYPGQDGGTALLDIIRGVRAPAGRLVTTQYPASYAEEFPATDMNLRPEGDNPGQTYIWYTGEPVYPFGHGLFYTSFSFSSASLGQNMSASATAGGKSYNITSLLTAPHEGYNTPQQKPFLNFTVDVTNTGERASDYTAMLFVNTTAGPAPYPNKWLVGFDRVGELQPGDEESMTFPVTMEDVARTNERGDRVVYPGRYELALNNERDVVMRFVLVGEEVVILKWPEDKYSTPSE